VSDDAELAFPHEAAGVGRRDVQLAEVGTAWNVLALAGREIVDDDDVIAGGQEAISHVRPDEAGAASDQDARH
jgi:hypothetical protein